MLNQKTIPDHASEAGAHALVVRLRNYWGERGYGFVGDVIPEKLRYRAEKPLRFDVRSNMVSGFPPKVM